MIFVKKKRYYAIYLVKQEGSFSYVKKKRFRPTNDTLIFRDGEYKVNIGFPSYIRGIKLYYFIDIDGAQIGMNANYQYDPKLLKMFARRQIIKQLSSSLAGGSKIQYFWLIMGIALGIFGTLGVLYFM